MPLISARGIEGPPTLVVEVLSPSTSSIDRGVKAQLYSRFDVPYYWIVDPDGRTIEAYQPWMGGTSPRSHRGHQPRRPRAVLRPDARPRHHLALTAAERRPML